MGEKVTFNRDMVEKITKISLNVADYIYKEVERLDLSPEEKTMANYYIARNYYESVERSLKEIGVCDIIVKKKGGIRQDG